MNNKGLLLINLGTPDAPTTKATRKYLRQFLSDPRVVDLPFIGRQLLLNCIILPFRPKKSAQAYQQIWGPQGSPLLVNSESLLKKIQTKLKNSYQQIEIAMRYGNPSIKDTLKKFSTCSSITILPLFPQYASSSTGSAIEETMKQLKKQNNIPEIKIIGDFFDHQNFISSWTKLLKEHQKENPWEHLIFSYHGLPERHVLKSETKKISCDINNECPSIGKHNRFCYRAQCYETTRLIAKEYGLKPDEYTVAFQSRLGVRRWIRPYTDKILPEIHKKGFRKIAVTCPSFVADCLETLEEIAIRAKEDWIKLGGKDLTLVSSLNDKDFWVDDLAKIIG
jgi:protoporphyrin/coproporphyrin ferrochelatase